MLWILKDSWELGCLGFLFWGWGAMKISRSSDSVRGVSSPPVTPFMLRNLAKSLADPSNSQGDRVVSSKVEGRQQQEPVVGKREVDKGRKKEEDKKVPAATTATTTTWVGSANGWKKGSEEEKRNLSLSEEKGEKGVMCTERAGGVQWRYLSLDGKKGMRVVHAQQQRDPYAEFVTFVKSYMLPEGYPESVAPAYTPYMQWRAAQYFFGGAMAVFTTRSLLHALGVSRRGATSSAVAVNWVIKDGAGRIGKMVFARHGKKFDCDLKQLRIKGAMLMQLGAGVELATMAVPHLFLPLACAANVAKNVAAVTSTSTRAPIYKAFACRENIGDVTAKGECISNIADLLGTGLGIFISKRNPSLVATFCVLSCGYLVSSFNEVKAVRLPTLNRARFGVAVHSFLDTGQVPSLEEANKNEGIITLPWAQEKPLELGARVSQAFANAQDFTKAVELFQNEKYMVTYRPSRRRAYVVIKDSATSEDVLRAAFQANVMLHTLRNTRGIPEARQVALVENALAESVYRTNSLYEDFKQQATAKGWLMGESYLNPGDARLCQ